MSKSNLPPGVSNSDIDNSIEHDELKPITIIQLARFRGAKESADGSINGAEFYRVGLPILGGCLICEATIAAYNAYPSKSGYLKCRNCIGDDGYATVEEANREIFADEVELTSDKGISENG